MAGCTVSNVRDVLGPPGRQESSSRQVAVIHDTSLDMRSMSIRLFAGGLCLPDVAVAEKAPENTSKHKKTQSLDHQAYLHSCPLWRNSVHSK